MPNIQPTRGSGLTVRRLLARLAFFTLSLSLTLTLAAPTSAFGAKKKRTRPSHLRPSSIIPTSSGPIHRRLPASAIRHFIPPKNFLRSTSRKPKKIRGWTAWPERSRNPTVERFSGSWQSLTGWRWIPRAASTLPTRSRRHLYLQYGNSRSRTHQEQNSRPLRSHHRSGHGR